jgi:asparaginyl-tRNA synthetase
MSIKSRTKIADAIISNEIDREITVKGWVRTRRGNKNIAFIALNDGSTDKQYSDRCRCSCLP